MGAKERPSWYSYHGDIWRATKCTLQKLLRYRLRAGYHAIHIYISDDVLSCIPYLKAAKDRFRKIGERPNWAVSHYKIRVLGENAPKIHSIVHKYRYIREIPYPKQTENPWAMCGHAFCSNGYLVSFKRRLLAMCKHAICSDGDLEMKNGITAPLCRPSCSRGPVITRRYRGLA